VPNPLSISVAVHGNPDSASLKSAIGFISAALAAGHSIYRVFFYHDGARIADEVANLSILDSDSQRALAELKKREDVELAICVGAATRRGLLSQPESGTAGNTSELDPVFEVVGLGQLIDAIVQSDRFVTFAA
jgi:tRNA 2-thiouridine synthesizing protein D